MAQGPSDTILVAIRITLWIRESKVRNPDPPISGGLWSLSISSLYICSFVQIQYLCVFAVSSKEFTLLYCLVLFSFQYQANNGSEERLQNDQFVSNRMQNFNLINVHVHCIVHFLLCFNLLCISYCVLSAVMSCADTTAVTCQCLQFSVFALPLLYILITVLVCN